VRFSWLDDNEISDFSSHTGNNVDFGLFASFSATIPVMSNSSFASRMSLWVEAVAMATSASPVAVVENRISDGVVGKCWRVDGSKSESEKVRMNAIGEL
jgi:hypothetical protein